MSMSDERKKFFHYIFITALEGGIKDWAVREEYCYSKTCGPMGKGEVLDDLDNFHAIISSSEDDWGVGCAYVSEVKSWMPITEDQLLRIDLSVIERGWYLFMDKVLEAFKSEDPTADFSGNYFRQFIVQYLTNMEDGDSDSDGADLVVQLGLFGEHVYG